MGVNCINNISFEKQCFMIKYDINIYIVKQSPVNIFQKEKKKEN